MESPSLIKRHQMEVSSKLRVNATSSDMSNADIGDVMAGLETHFKNYEDRIVNNTYTSPAPDSKWRTDSLSMTQSEISAVKTQTEVAEMEDELSIKSKVAKANPVLARSAMLRGASGRCVQIDAQRHSSGSFIHRACALVARATHSSSAHPHAASCTFSFELAVTPLTRLSTGVTPPFRSCASSPPRASTRC